MFERYTELARRTIFFARYEAGKVRSPYIDTEHLLLGLLRHDELLRSTLPEGSAAEIRDRIESAERPVAKALEKTVDIPLSPDGKLVLTYAAEESESLGSRTIDNRHLLLGLLRLESCIAAVILHENGIRVDEYRDLVKESYVSQSPLEDPPAGVARNLDLLITQAMYQLEQWSDEEGAKITKRKGWSRKEALGHLIDCALVHRICLARALTGAGTIVVPAYPTDDWVAAQGYGACAWNELANQWASLNRLLVHVMGRVSEDKLNLVCRFGVADPMPLSSVMSNYVRYCSDVVGQILTYGQGTK